METGGLLGRVTGLRISNSPWARPLSVLGSILGARKTVTNRSSELPNVATREKGRSSEVAMSTGTEMGENAGFGPNDPVPVYVRWHSSVRMRQALDRLGRFRVKAPESAAIRLSERLMEDYQIAVIAPIMGTFNDLSLEDLKPKTFLTSKKDKSKKTPLKSYTAPRNRSDGAGREAGVWTRGPGSGVFGSGREDHPQGLLQACQDDDRGTTRPVSRNLRISVS